MSEPTFRLCDFGGKIELRNADYLDEETGRYYLRMECIDYDWQGREVSRKMLEPVGYLSWD